MPSSIAPSPVKVMVASTIYGFQDQLEQIVGVLRGYGYFVMSSHLGSVRVDPNKSNLDNCKLAVAGCDAFFGIIRPNYGSGVIGDRSITHEECLQAVTMNKPRWFVVDRNVVVGGHRCRPPHLRGDEAIMTPQDLKALLAQGESQHVEFKEEMPSAEFLAQSVCAFLNTGGGRILIGVGDGGRILGVPNALAQERSVQDGLRKAVSPGALWTIDLVTIGSVDVVVIDIPDGVDKPFVANGAIYFRRGTHDVPATRTEINTLISSGAEKGLRWERRAAVGVLMVDLDQDLIRATLDKAVLLGRWKGSANDTEELLRSLGLLSDGSVTNAALLLFGKQPTRLLPQARARLVVMPDGKAGDQYSLDLSFDDCLLRMIEKIPKALEPYMGTSSSFAASDWKRIDTQKYPAQALREGVVNALVHRDYDAQGSVTIAIDPGAIKIANPGSLPADLTPADLKRDHLSNPRNPDVLHVCYLHGYTEKLGRGTQRILADCRQAHLKDPKWISSKVETSLTIYASTRLAQVDDELNARQRKLLEVLESKGELGIRELASGLDVSERTVRNDLRSLVDRGRIGRRGRGPSTRYTVITHIKKS